MFTARGSVMACDKPDGAAVAARDRMLLNEERELDQSWIHFRQSATGWEILVPRVDLSFDCAEPARTSLIQAASDRYAEAMQDQFAHVSCQLHQVSNGIEVHLQLRPDGDHVEDYVYSLCGGKATPLTMRRYFGPGESIGHIGSSMSAAVIATAALLVFEGVLLFARNRKRRDDLTR